MFAHPRTHLRLVATSPLKGALVLVVGPSGAGKDSLIAGARTRLASAEAFIFPRREITRPRDVGGEEHVEVAESQFHARRELGGYLLSWGAHGLWYGIPFELENDLREGRTVIVNASRAVVDEARSRFENLRIVSVNADDETLRARLSGRGREPAEQIDRRLERARAFRIEGRGVIPFQNDGDLDEAVGRFTRLLLGIAGRV